MDLSYKLKLFLFTFVGGIVGYLPYLVVTYYGLVRSVTFYIIVGIVAYIFYIKTQDQTKVKHQIWSLILGLYAAIIFSQFLPILLIDIQTNNNEFLNNILSINTYDFSIMQFMIENLLAVIFAFVGVFIMSFIFKISKNKKQGNIDERI